MLESSNLVTFDGLANSSSYDTFLLDEERGRLLVGAEDHLFSFDLVNINRDKKQVRLREAMPLLSELLSSLHYSDCLSLPVIALRRLHEVSRFYQNRSTFTEGGGGSWVTKVQRNVQLLQVGRTFSSLSLCPELGSKIAMEQSKQALHLRGSRRFALKPPPHLCGSRRTTQLARQ